MKASVEQMRRFVLQELQRDYDSVHVIDVQISEEIDIDDSKILQVDVIFEGDARAIDVNELLALRSHLTPALTARSNGAFPVFSFIANHELAELRREPARSS